MRASTWGALLKGDLADAIVSETPGGIEAQEKAGQATFVRSDMLPKEVNGATREELVTLGFLFGNDIDDLFIEAKLPDGWTKKATDHDMHSTIFDEQGRQRAGVFYKAAFYDRRANMYMQCRYSCGVKPVNGWKNEEAGGWIGYVTDGDNVLWNVVMDDPEPEYKGHREEESKRQAWLDWLDKKDGLSLQAEAWLLEHFPDWRNPLAYW